MNLPEIDKDAMRQFYHQQFPTASPFELPNEGKSAAKGD